MEYMGFGSFARRRLPLQGMNTLFRLIAEGTRVFTSGVQFWLGGFGS